MRGPAGHKLPGPVPDRSTGQIFKSCPGKMGGGGRGGRGMGETGGGQGVGGCWAELLLNMSRRASLGPGLEPGCPANPICFAIGEGCCVTLKELLVPRVGGEVGRGEGEGQRRKKESASLPHSRHQH